MPSRAEFVERALAFLREVLGDAGASLHADTDLYTSDDVDSLVVVAFLEFVGDELGGAVDLDRLDPSRITTVGGAYDVLVRTMGPA